jgi:hypothetical protein
LVNNFRYKQLLNLTQSAADLKWVILKILP